MPTPYDLYIRFLVTKGVDELEQANEALADLNIHPVGNTEFEAQFSLVETSIPKNVQKAIEKIASTKRPSPEKVVIDSDFMRWMKVLEVEELWRYEPVFRHKHLVERPLFKLTYDIHQDPQLRLAINALLIKNMPPLDLIQAVNLRYSSMLKEEHVKLYKKFFFDPARMTRGAWNKFLRPCDDRETSIYFLALSETLDTLKTELELPSKVSASETLQFLLSKSFQKAKVYLNVNTPEAGKEAREWIDATIKLVDKYEKYRSGDMGDFSNQLQLAFDFVESEFQTPDPDVLKEISAKARKDADEKAKDEAKEAPQAPPPAAGGG